MRLLLDTHVLLWALAGERRLSVRTRRAIEAADQVMVSAAAVWEIAIKHALGKLRIDGDVALEAQRSGYLPLAVTVEHASAVGRLPQHHRDPFDRMLVAQALVEGLTLVTADPRLAAYPAPILTA